MKSLKLLLCLGLAAVGAHAASKNPMADWPKAYSVETVTTVAGTTSATKLFVDGDKIRTEMDANGMQMISIIRQDKKVSYTLMPAQKMVMENAIPDAPAAAGQSGPEPTWEKVGSANVNGVACTEYKVTTGADVAHYFLNSDNFLVRLATKDMTMDYKNFKAGAQDAALFEVPAGYSKPGEASASNSDNSGGSNSGAAPAPEEKPAKKKKGLGGMLGR
ncbi:MAG TPA: DUF4412 domain-containing protein [Opitutaceae bacterium]|nr:DUF4412 domain-containing protein [Opitutaceae bacterium]